MPHRYGRYVEEEVDGGGGGGSGGADDAAAKAAADAAAAAAAAAAGGTGGGGGGAPVQQGGGKTVVMPTAAVGRMKQEQRTLGKREAQTELEAKAKAAGFSSVDEAFAAAAEAKKNGGRQRQDQRNQGNQQQRQNGGGNGAQTTPQQQPNGRRDHKTAQQLDKERRQRILAERRAKEVQTNADAESARFSLERSAWNKGVRDTDYAITLLTRHCETLQDAELEKFDEQAYFEGLRKTHPFLFGETTIPANSGVGGNGAPTTPNPADVTRASGNGAPDVRKMNKADYEAHLRNKGYTPPSMA